MIVTTSLLVAACSAETPVTVMTFNLRNGKAHDGENSWLHRKDLLVETITRCRPDVLGVQESFDFQTDFIAQRLPEYHWVGVGRGQDGGDEMCAVFYRKEVLAALASGAFWLSETPEAPGSISWDSSLTRMAVWVRFLHRKTGRVFLCFNTHFDHVGQEARRNSARLLVERAAGLGADLPVVVLGDFNAEAERSAPWQILTESGFRDAWLAAAKREGPATTWGAFRPPQPGSEERIDWVMFRGRWAAEYCETVTYQMNGRYPSDHYPVLARLGLQAPE